MYGLVGLQRAPQELGHVDPRAAREIFIREELVNGEWPEDGAPPAVSQANARTIAKVEELEHKSRRQDVLVDDELIYAFYDAQVPPDISNKDFEAWWRDARRTQPDLLLFTRDELMRHEAAGITTSAFPR